jgi:hypothetical protein
MAVSTEAETSLRFKVRLAGGLYLLNIVTGASALFARGSAATATLLISTACYVGVTVLFYGLFSPVDRKLSALAAFMSLVGCTTSALSTLGLAAASLNPLVFFGVYCLLIGYLISRSTFLPRFLGVLMALGGLGWLTFASASLSGQLSPYNLAPGILGETVLTLWLLLAGVNVGRWLEQPSISRAA